MATWQSSIESYVRRAKREFNLVHFWLAAAKTIARARPRKRLAMNQIWRVQICLWAKRGWKRHTRLFSNTFCCNNIRCLGRKFCISGRQNLYDHWALFLNSSLKFNCCNTKIEMIVISNAIVIAYMAIATETIPIFYYFQHQKQNTYYYYYYFVSG